MSKFLLFSSRYGIIFETLGSLLSLLRSGDRDAYRQFFQDVMTVVQGTKLQIGVIIAYSILLIVNTYSMFLFRN